MEVLANVRVRNLAMVEARKKKGITQKQLAVAVGCGVSTISNIELLYNVDVPGIDLLLNDIAYVLDVPFDKIFPKDYLRALASGRFGFDRKFVFTVSLDVLLPMGRAERELEAQFEEQDTALRLQEVVESLPGREAEVIKKHFGIGDAGGPMTFDAIAMELGVSNARVQQIEHTALQRLRHPAVRRQFRNQD